MNRFFAFVLAVMLCASCGKSGRNYDIIPFPESLTPRAGAFDAAKAAYTLDPSMDEASRAFVTEFAAELASAAGTEAVFAENPQAGFVFKVEESLPAESYVLDIDSKRAIVKASSLRGFVYAVQTVKQLLPVDIFGREPAPSADWSVPCAYIEDSPRFGYRGLEIDVARHFFDVAQMKKILNLMTLHKLNTLHWHLTDDQGWRIEIKKYPRLTEYGSIRKQTMIRKEWGHYDGVPYGGYYTQDEIRDVVAYAAARGITVIPEIDLPGHMQAALACYPELGCTGGPYEVWQQWGISEDVLCPGKEQTFRFIEDVLTELMELFPSEYIHIGGDECPKVRWEKCPHCQARIKALGLKGDDKHTAEHYLQSYVTARVEKFLNDHGRSIIGWDEILEGELAPNATVMSWRGSEGGIQAAAMGHDVLMTPNTHFYFDYYQSQDIANEPLGIGGYIPVEKVYSYEPYTDEMTAEARSHIKGVQANLWSEYIATPEHQEYMLLPRMAALSEIQWCRPENKAWERFIASLPHIIDIYDRMGCTYATAVFDITGKAEVDADRNCVLMTLTTAGNAPIYYTLDGSEPTTASSLYKSPVEITAGCTLKAKSFRNNIGTRTFEQHFADSKALGRPAQLNTTPAPRYTFGGAPTLVDGVESVMSFSNGAWIGWLHEPLDVTIDMGGETAYSSVRLCTLVQKYSWIFPPVSLTVSISDDNETFAEAAALAIPESAQGDADGLFGYEVEFPETSARYLRVEAQPLSRIPDWHDGRGNKAHLFAGEIIVR